MPKAPALDPATIEPLTKTVYPPPFDKTTLGRRKTVLGVPLGLTQFGVNITEIPPKSATSLRHWHSHEDEFVYVISGEATLVTDDGEQTLTAGMVVGFPAGKRDGHTFLNHSDAPVVLLEVGTRDLRDEGNYPDVDLHCLPRRYEGARFTKKDGTPID